MKLVDFFVALGFDIKGDEKLAQVEKNLSSAEVKGVGLLAAVTALNAAFYLIEASALRAAVSLQKFALGTGLSTDELQRWQYAGRLANVQASETLATIQSIQKAQADINLGQGNIAPFQFFGLSVNQTPFEVMQRLHEVIQRVDPAIARTMAAQLGISDTMFQFLRRTNLELDRFNTQLGLTASQRHNLETLNHAWQDILASLEGLKNRFAETFAAPLAVAARVLKTVIDLVASFVDWLGKDTLAANATRWALFGVVLMLGLLAAALTALTAVLGLVLGAVKLLSLAALPVLAALAPIALVVGLLVVGLGILIVLIQDFWVACRGGKSAFDWNENLILSVRNVERLATAIEKLLGVWDKFKKMGSTNVLGQTMFSTDWLGHQVAAPAVSSTGKSVTQTNHITTHVDGADDPKATGREVGKGVKQAITEAAYQLPGLSY